MPGRTWMRPLSGAGMADKNASAILPRRRSGSNGDPPFFPAARSTLRAARVNSFTCSAVQLYGIVSSPPPAAHPAGLRELRQVSWLHAKGLNNIKPFGVQPSIINVRIYYSISCQKTQGLAYPCPAPQARVSFWENHKRRFMLNN